MLPTTVNILGTLFSVVENETLDGEAGHSLQTYRSIKVCETLAPDAKVETFYHEVVHMVLRHTGLAAVLGEVLEEAVAQGMGVALAQIISENEVLPIIEEDTHE